LKGFVHIYSDCLGALEKVKNLPPTRIPSRLAHSDVLKNILVNCSNLSFDPFYSHVHAHQDGKEEYHNLSMPSQLNLNMDFNAKQTLLDLQPTNLPCQQAFPLESVCVFAGSWKITADMGSKVQYLAHLKLARKKFHQMSILDAQVFNLGKLGDGTQNTPRCAKVVSAMGMQAGDGNCRYHGMGQGGTQEMSKLYAGA
jgi:hypothetical protein